MKNKSLRVTFLVCFISSALSAQTTRFVRSGVIEYDKAVNMYTLMRKQVKSGDLVNGRAFEVYKNTHPQIQIIKSKLIFADNKVLFTPAANNENENNIIKVAIADQNNPHYTDISANKHIAQKTVLDETFLVTDSTRKIKWKITDETRDIAGYTCRRANGIVLDSIYVVAFFTNEIAVSGGPEAFSGLPGMILQVALPHENVSWIATRVTDTTVPPNTIVPLKKGKVITETAFKAILLSQKIYWGVYENDYLKALML